MNVFAWMKKRLAVRIAVIVMAVIILLSAGYIWLQISNAKNTAMKVITSYGTLMGESYASRSGDVPVSQ